MKIGGNSPTQGFTDRARAAAETLGPGVMLWLSSAQPGDAVRYPNCVHLLRLDNWSAGENPSAYAQRIAARLQAWRSAIPGVVAVLGNEPDIEAGHHGEGIAGYVAAVKAAFPGVAVANPPLSVQASALATFGGCDVRLAHSYFERQHPEDRGNPQFGASYLHALSGAGATPVYVSEFNVVQINCPIDWPDRNAQVAQWIADAEGKIDGVCLFILDGQGDWASFDIGPEAAADILAHIPKSPTSTGYTRDSDPRGYRPLDARWLPFVAAHNPDEAEEICRAYDEGARRIDYDANAMIAQGCVETACFTSQRWRNAHSAAGIGIFADATLDIIWGHGPHGDATDGIHAQADLLTCYFGDDEMPYGQLTPHGFGGMALHKTSLRGLDGVWAADTGYSAAIVGYLNSVLGNGPVPPPTPPVPNVPVVTGDMVADRCLAYLGDTAFSDEGSTVPALERCEEFIEVAHEDLGIPRHRWFTAVDHGRALQAAGLLVTDPAQFRRGMVGFWDETFFAGAGHTSDYLGDGTFCGAGGSAIAISPETWIHHPGFMGMCFYPGVGEARQTDERGVPVGDGFNQAEILRLWFGNKTASQQKQKKFAFRQGFGVENTYVAAANGLWEGAPGRSIVLGEVMGDEEFDPGTPGRSIRYFQNGKVTALKQPDGTYLFKIN